MEKKVVLITGASNGIGKSMVYEFAKKGYHVVLNYNNSKDSANNIVADLTKKGYSVIAIKADVADYVQVEYMVQEAIKTFGHIDVLINNAGVCCNKILIDTSTYDIASIISTNLIGTINVTKATIPHFINRNKGKIINISSVWGIYGASGESVYSASKGGIISFTKSMAKELAYNNINVNCIAPGVVDTKMMKKFTKKELNDIKDEIPLGRLAKPKEIADVALFLSSKNAIYITGQVIEVDGGYCL